MQLGWWSECLGPLRPRQIGHDNGCRRCDKRGRQCVIGWPGLFRGRQRTVVAEKEGQKRQELFPTTSANQTLGLIQTPFSSAFPSGFWTPLSILFAPSGRASWPGSAGGCRWCCAGSNSFRLPPSRPRYSCLIGGWRNLCAIKILRLAPHLAEFRPRYPMRFARRETVSVLGSTCLFRATFTVGVCHGCPTCTTHIR